MSPASNGKGAWIAFPACILGFAVGLVWAQELPASLTSPAPRVVCNAQRSICYDRQGSSIGLTEVFLGKASADRLLAWLHEHPVDRRPGAVFSPAEGIECVLETGPCRDSAQTLAGLTAALFGPWPERNLPASSRQRSDEPLSK